MEEEIVSFETAMLLKEKGFNEPCSCFYEDNELCKLCYYQGDGTGFVCNNSPINEKVYCEEIQYTAPTQSLAQKWLREMKDIIVIADYNMTYPRKWNYECWKDNVWEYSNKYYETYEEALEEGLKKALELI